MKQGERLITILALVFGMAMGTGCNGTTSEADPPIDETVDSCPLPGASVRLGGNNTAGADNLATPTRRLVLMGGGSEDDEASTRFVEAAGGGDVVILRASGSLTSYPDYFTSTLTPQPTPASTVTLLTDNPEAADDAAVLCWLGRAEAVWLPGGDQWNYLGRWPSAVHTALAALAGREAAVGGTSAGAVSLGEAAFDAQAGTVTSEEALAAPLAPEVSLTYPPFAQPELSGMLVDSHFMDRSREGRLLAFLARFLVDRGYTSVIGIGLDEGVALTLEDGTYRVRASGRGAAWLYQVTGPVSLAEGAPLSLTSVRRVRLGNGQQGPWPLHFDLANAEDLVVTEGDVQVQ